MTYYFDIKLVSSISLEVFMDGSKMIANIKKPKGQQIKIITKRIKISSGCIALISDKRPSIKGSASILANYCNFPYILNFS